MHRLTAMCALSLALAVVSGCTRENPRTSYQKMLNNEESRSTEQMAELRNRITGQSQR